MEKRVFTVLRSGGEYTPEHVQAIQRQVRKWASEDTAFYCISDIEIPGVRNRIPLKHSWPGWWSKIELFRPDLPTEFLYTDLDNVILGSIDHLVSTDKFTADIGFSFFRVTSDVNRQTVYDAFRAATKWHMDEWDPANRTDGKFGDAAFLRSRMGLMPDGWPKDEVVNIVHASPPCPWGTPGVFLNEKMRVLLCGGKRRRPWRNLSQRLQRAYWCR